MTRLIYTTGYAGRDIFDLKPLVHALDALLVDIRFTPESDLMHWRRIYLKTLLGKKYRHVPHLGARSFRRSSSDAIQNLQLGVQTLLNLDSNIILMCVCAEYDDCHRRLIATELEQQGINVVEIFDWKRPIPETAAEGFKL